MYHIALCTSYIAYFNLDSFMHILIDHVESKSEIKKEQVQGVFGGPQVPSARILTLHLDQGKP
jgi:hypothetical protein